MAKDAYTFEELAQQIRRGGSVSHGGRLIRTLADLRRVFDTPESIEEAERELAARKVALAAKQSGASEETKKLSPSSEVTDELPEGFPGRAQLEAAGITTLSEVQAKTNEELDAIEGIGPATVTAIREALKK